MARKVSCGTGAAEGVEFIRDGPGGQDARLYPAAPPHAKPGTGRARWPGRCRPCRDAHRFRATIRHPPARSDPMKWRSARRSSNVEDRRGMGPGGGGMKLGLGGVAIVVVISLLTGQN